MTINQKAAVLATLEGRMENICRQLERETDSYTRECLIESLGELIGGYMHICTIKPSDWDADTDSSDEFSGCPVKDCVFDCESCPCGYVFDSDSDADGSAYDIDSDAEDLDGCGESAVSDACADSSADTTPSTSSSVSFGFGSVSLSDMNVSPQDITSCGESHPVGGEGSASGGTHPNLFSGDKSGCGEGGVSV